MLYRLYIEPFIPNSVLHAYIHVLFRNGAARSELAMQLVTDELQIRLAYVVRCSRIYMNHHRRAQIKPRSARAKKKKQNSICTRRAASRQVRSRTPRTTRILHMLIVSSTIHGMELYIPSLRAPRRVVDRSPSRAVARSQEDPARRQPRCSWPAADAGIFFLSKMQESCASLY